MIYVHTSKAVRDGCPGDRLFFVVSKTGRDVLAWKVTIESSGLLNHPAFDAPKTLDELLADKDSFRCGSTQGTFPTASFVKDSYYKSITPEQVRVRIKKLCSVRREVSSIPLSKMKRVHFEFISEKDVMAKFDAEPRHTRESFLKMKLKPGAKIKVLFTDSPMEEFEISDDREPSMFGVYVKPKPRDRCKEPKLIPYISILNQS